jgi:hypothetical protein
MKFCCDRFESGYNMPNHYGLNIRIVKYTKEELIDKQNLYRYYITPGYKEIDVKVPCFNIAFCPFCGTNLFSFYTLDEFINEVSGKF